MILDYLSLFSVYRGGVPKDNWEKITKGHPGGLPMYMGQ